MSASNMSFNRPLLQVCFLERIHPRLGPFMLCSQISDHWSMNFTVGRPKLRAQIAAALQLSCRNAYLSIAFAPQALPNADKNGVSSPPRWIWSNKNPFRQKPAPLQCASPKPAVSSSLSENDKKCQGIVGFFPCWQKITILTSSKVRFNK